MQDVKLLVHGKKEAQHSPRAELRALRVSQSGEVYKEAFQDQRSSYKRIDIECKHGIPRIWSF